MKKFSDIRGDKTSLLMEKIDHKKILRKKLNDFCFQELAWFSFFNISDFFQPCILVFSWWKHFYGLGHGHAIQCIDMHLPVINMHLHVDTCKYVLWQVLSDCRDFLTLWPNQVGGVSTKCRHLRPTYQNENEKFGLGYFLFIWLVEKWK